MTNSEDQDTSVDYNEKERQHPQIDHHPREVMVQTQRDLELSLKRRSISGVYPRKRYQRGNFDEKHPGQRSLTQFKKLYDYMQELLKQKKDHKILL